MELTKDTTIESLYEANMISVRAFNCLRRARLETIGQIAYEYPDRERLMDVRSIGVKTAKEINELMSAYERQQHGERPSSKDILFARLGERYGQELSQAYQRFLTGDEVVSAYLMERFPTVADLHSMILSDGDALKTLNLDLSKEQNLEVRKRFIEYLSTAERLRSLGAAAPSVCRAYLDRLAELRADRLGLSYIDLYRHFLTESQRELVTLAYQELLEDDLSGRAMQFLAQHAPTLEGMIALFTATDKDYLTMAGGRNIKVTIQEVRALVERLRVRFDELYKREQEDLERSVCGKRFPFLQPEQQQFVLDFQRAHDRLPLFYLLLYYLIYSRNRYDIYYVWYHGLSCGVPFSRKELSETFGVSPERVRQLLAKGPAATGVPLVTKSDWTPYQSLLGRLYFLPEDPDLKALIESEQLPLDERGAVALLNVVVPHEVVQVKGLTVVLNQGLLPHLRVDALEKSLDEIMQGTYTRDTQVPITTCLDYLEGDELEQGRLFAAWVLREGYHAQLKEDREIVCAKNKDDVRTNLMDWLREAGEPLSLDALYALYLQDCPEDPVSPDKLRWVLLNTEGIKAIGKSGRYGLSDWEDVFFGTIRDLVYQTLSSSEEPVEPAALLQVVLTHFPNTSMHNLQSSLRTDKRIVQFEENLYGLAEKSYSEQYTLCSKDSKRFFKRFIHDLRLFAQVNKRLPLWGGSEKETQLRRTMYKLENDVLKSVTPEQKREYATFLRACEQVGYPSTKADVDFRDSCQELMGFMEGKKRWPDAGDGVPLVQTTQRISSTEEVTGVCGFWVNQVRECAVSLGLTIPKG